MSKLVIPDRDDLARELFVADNANASREEALRGFYEQAGSGEIYVHYLADAAIAAFRKANR